MAVGTSVAVGGIVAVGATVGTIVLVGISVGVSVGSGVAVSASVAVGGIVAVGMAVGTIVRVGSSVGVNVGSGVAVGASVAVGGIRVAVNGTLVSGGGSGLALAGNVSEAVGGASNGTQVFPSDVGVIVGLGPGVGLSVPVTVEEGVRVGGDKTGLLPACPVLMITGWGAGGA